MSAETSKWLNILTLIGYVLKRGTAWHYREASQGDEPNHYDGPIPVADVERRLFNFDFREGEIYSPYVDSEGNKQVMHGSNLKSIIREPGSLGPDDEGAILYIPTTGFKVHPFRQTLVERAQRILDMGAGDEIGIASAGLLKGGAVAWVQFELPETMTVEGFEYRPFFTTATSVDGSMSTTDITGEQAVVCDNTLAGAHSMAKAMLKFKHSSNSLNRLSDSAIRDDLGLRLQQVSEAFEAQVKEMLSVHVSDQQLVKYFDLTIPVQGKEPGRGLTMATNKRDAKMTLWTDDPRVAPYRNTLFGVLQLENTYAHHFANVKGASRVERNMLNAVTGKFATLDSTTLDNLALVLA